MQLSGCSLNIFLFAASLAIDDQVVDRDVDGIAPRSVMWHGRHLTQIDPAWPAHVKNFVTEVALSI